MLSLRVYKRLLRNKEFSKLRSRFKRDIDSFNHQNPLVLKLGAVFIVIICIITHNDIFRHLDPIK